MGTQVVGSLEIQMLTNLAHLSRDMAEAKKVVGDTMGTISKSVDGLKSMLFGLAGPLLGIASIGAFKSMINDVIEAKVQLQRLSIQTGASVEGLGAIGATAKLTGNSITDVAAAMNKMQKAVATSNDDSKGAAQAIAALGLGFDEFAKMKPDQQMLAVAKSMAGFEDGAGKVAVAMTLWGKAGAQLLPMLKELAERDELVGKTTAESARQAEQYEKNMKKLDAAGQQWKRAMVDAMLSALVDITNAMVEARKQGDLLSAVWAGLGEAGSQFMKWRDRTAAQNFISLAENDVKFLRERQANMGSDPYWDASRAELDKQIAAKAVAVSKAKQDYYQLLGTSTAGSGRGFVNPTTPKKELDASGIKGPLGNALDKRTAGDSFLEQLQRQVQLHEKDKFAMLELEAIQKKVPVQAQVHIDKLREIEERELRIKATVQEVTRNLEYEAAQRARISGFIEGGNSAAGSVMRETEMLGLNADAQRRLTELRKVDDLVQKTSIGLSADQVVELRRLAEVMKNNLGQALDEQKKKQDALNGSWQYGARQALDDYQKSIANAAENTRAAMTKGFKGMEDALVNFVTTGKLDFKSLANSIISDMVRISIQKSIMAPFSKGFEAGGIIGGIRSIFGFANGGDPPVGVPSLVGERGPELFVPRTAGTIVPNGALGGATYNITLHQTVGDVATLSALRKSQEQTVQIIQSGIGRSRMYGGAMS